MSRNVSLKRQISTSCWFRKCSRWSFLLRNPFAFQQARRRDLHCSVLLGVLPYSPTNIITVFRTDRGRSAPVGREMDVRSRRVSSTHAWRGRRSRGSEISSSREMEIWVGTTRLGLVDLAIAVLTLAAAFFLDFPVAGLGDAVGFGSGFWGLVVFLAAVSIGCSGASVTGCGEGFGLGVEWRWLGRHADLGRRGFIPRPSPSAR